MLQEVKPDVVFISTNWNNHAPVAIECMKQGAHAFVGVPLAVTLRELGKLSILPTNAKALYDDGKRGYSGMN